MSETYVNFLGGSPLNRLSWLRTSATFLNAIAISPSTRWIAFRRGDPLISGPALARLTTDEIRPLIGSEPFFGQGQNAGELVEEGISIVETARFRGPPIVFLGLDEHQQKAEALPSSEFSGNDPQVTAQNFNGTPYFTIDLTNVPEGQVDDLLRDRQFTFSEPRAAMQKMNMDEAGLFAVARSMVDWNARNKFCPSCAAPVYSLWAGWKLSCSSLTPWADNTGKEPCPTAKGLHNFAHPRTDPVVIMVVTNEANDRILLGRNKKFPGSFYSALAGFIEPGESFEDAVKRELWEEAGVRVWNVKYHSTQPWPFPANLMVGFFATADPAQPIRTDLDNELEDARWYTREEVIAVLEHAQGTNFTRRDWRQVAEVQEGKPDTATSGSDPLAGDAAAAANKAQSAANLPVKKEHDAPAFRVPPTTAIAGVLISHWAYEKPPPPPAPTPVKGNL